MRILKVTQSYAPFFEFGGPPVKVRALAQRLASRGHEVTVLTADWGLKRRLNELRDPGMVEASPFGKRSKDKGVTADYLRNWAHYRALSWNPGLGRYLRARLKEFDVVHIYGLYDFLGPRTAKECRERGVPYIVEPIGMYVPLVRNIWLKKMYHWLWGREMLAGASVIIATAEQEREELVAGGLPREKIVLRRNGVETPEEWPEPGEFRRRLGISQDAKLILFLGRLSQKKSPDLLLKAFVEFQVLARNERAEEDNAKTQKTQKTQRGPGDDVHTAFVGPDEAGMKRRLQGIARRSGLLESVHFCGALDGAAKWAAYRDADIFVLPSQNENFGNTAAEAVAAGTPVIVTERCGIAPLLKDLAALVVEHDEKALREALLLMLRDERLYSRLREGCAKAMARLGWEEPVTQMELIYSRLAGSSAP